MLPPLLFFGAILLVAMAIHDLASRLGLPRVTLLMFLGVAVGPIGLGVVSTSAPWLAPATDVALTMVGLLLGGEFTISAVRQHGLSRLGLTVGLVAGTAVTVTLGLLALGIDLPLALILGGVAPATAPAATVAVLDELDARGPFAATVRSLVALDDVFGLLAFSLALAAAAVSTGHSPWAELGTAMAELGGSVLFGGVLGAVAAPITGRIRAGKPTMLEALGLVGVCAGGAEWLHLSPLLSAVTMGTVLANVASHHERAFRQVEDLEWPVLVLFFVLAGASLELDALTAAGPIVVAYVVLRIIGRYVGIGAGAVATGQTNRATLVWLPTALMPQAGVALGLALAAAEQHPVMAEQLLPVVIASTLFFEIVGPPLTRLAVHRTTGDAEA